VKVRKLVVHEVGADGKRIKRPSTKFYAVFIDWSDALRRLPLLEDRRASEVLARTVDRLNNVRAGGDVLTPDLAEAVERMPPAILAKLAAWGILSGMRLAAGKRLAEHVADWRAALLAKGGTLDYANLSAQRVKRILAACGFRTWSDLSASKVQRYLAGLRQPTADSKGISAGSFNAYLTAIKGFCKWAVRDGRASESPLEHLGGVNVRTDRRHDRRPLAAGELRWLLDTTDHGPERFGMSGAERAMLYRLAVGSGLRANELHSLTRASFRLEGVEPAVVVAAAYSKHRREDVQPIRMDLAALLKAHLANTLPQARAFDMPDESRVAKMFRAHLADARTAWLESRRMPASACHSTPDALEGGEDPFLAYRDAGGRFSDFHALRHSFITAAVTGGVNVKQAQTLARHSTSALTLDRYSHQYAGNLTAALNVLPDLSAPTHEKEKMTGTDGRMVGKNAPCQNPVNPVSPPVSLECAALSSLVESCGVNKQMSASAESLGKTERNHAFTGGNERTHPAGLEPATDGLEIRCSIQLSYGCSPLQYNLRPSRTKPPAWTAPKPHRTLHQTRQHTQCRET